MNATQQDLRRFKKRTQFFETPDIVADLAASMLDGIGRDARILEPSAGRGALIRAVGRAVRYPIKPIEFCEREAGFWPDLERLGAVRVGEDFLAYNPGLVYCAALMNPPFAKGADFEHVLHAWDCVRDGGRVVALTSRPTADRLCDEFDGHVFEREDLDAGAFEETTVRTSLLLIHKPLGWS